MLSENDIHYGPSQTVALISDFKNNVTVSIDGEPIGVLPTFFRVFSSGFKN